MSNNSERIQKPYSTMELNCCHTIMISNARPKHTDVAISDLWSDWCLLLPCVYVYCTVYVEWILFVYACVLYTLCVHDAHSLSMNNMGFSSSQRTLVWISYHLILPSERFASNLSSFAINTPYYIDRSGLSISMLWYVEWYFYMNGEML